MHYIFILNSIIKINIICIWFNIMQFLSDVFLVNQYIYIGIIDNNYMYSHYMNSY